MPWIALLLFLSAFSAATSAANDPRLPGEDFTAFSYQAPVAGYPGYVQHGISWRPERYRLYTLETMENADTLDSGPWVPVATAYGTSAAADRIMRADLFTVAPPPPTSGPPPAAPPAPAAQRFALISLWRTSNNPAAPALWAQWTSPSGTVYNKQVASTPASLPTQTYVSASLEGTATPAGQTMPVHFSFFIMLSKDVGAVPTPATGTILDPVENALWSAFTAALPGLSAAAAPGTVTPAPPAAGVRRKYWRVKESSDTDGDGLPDQTEVEQYGTSPFNNDTDGDGVQDADEISRGLNPRLRDTDADGLTDGAELAAGTDPLRLDTDYDGIKDSIDGVPAANGTPNPNGSIQGTGPLKFDLPKLSLTLRWRDSSITATGNGPFSANNNSRPYKVVTTLSKSGDQADAKPVTTSPQVETFITAFPSPTGTALVSDNWGPAYSIYPVTPAATAAITNKTILRAEYSETRTWTANGPTVTTHQRDIVVGLVADRPMPVTWYVKYKIWRYTRSDTPANYAAAKGGLWSIPAAEESTGILTIDKNATVATGEMFAGGQPAFNPAAAGLADPTQAQGSLNQEIVLVAELAGGGAPVTVEDPDADGVPTQAEGYTGTRHDSAYSASFGVTDGDFLTPNLYAGYDWAPASRDVRYYYNASDPLALGAGAAKYLKLDMDRPPEHSDKTVGNALDLGATLQSRISTDLSLPASFSKAPPMSRESVHNPEPRDARAFMRYELGSATTTGGQPQSACGDQQRVWSRLAANPTAAYDRTFLRVTKVFSPSPIADIIKVEPFTFSYTTASNLSSNKADLLAELPATTNTSSPGTWVVDESLASVEFQRDEDEADGKWQLAKGQLVKALPGQKINLRLNPNTLPAGLTVADYQWVLPSTVFKDFEADQSHGKLTPLQAADKAQAEVHFYFADSGSKSIVLKCKINAKAFEFTLPMVIEKPATTFFPMQGVTKFDSMQTPTKIGLFAGALMLGGMDFIGKVSVPAGWPEGKWHWLQLTTTGRTYVPTSGVPLHWSLNGQKVLDTNYPYNPPPFGGHPGVTGGYATNTQQLTTDAPFILLAGLQATTIMDYFEMFIMFLPDGKASRYVPTLSVQWTWGGSATLTGAAWSLTSPNQTMGTAVETAVHPEWTTNAALGTRIP